MAEEHEWASLFRQIAEQRLAESGFRLMKLGGQLGAAKLLCDHFGSPEAVQAAGLPAQLRFLLHEVSQPDDRREWFAIGWYDANQHAIQPENLGEEDISIILEVGALHLDRSAGAILV